ncbi:olfactory receptor 10A7-like [Lithobates pipiens]
MQDANKTTLMEFQLVGFSSFLKYHSEIFYAVLLAYIVCIIGNFIIIVLVMTHISLQIPMYFFIFIFAISEMMCVSVTIPKLLYILAKTDYRISVIGCFTQMYALHAIGETECFLLALMAFDRFLAINNPLQYSSVMNNAFCCVLGTLPWMAGFIISFIPVIFTALLEYCGPNKIDQFFCDLAPLQNLACSNPTISNFVTMLAAIPAVVFPFTMIVVLYITIIKTVLKINSNAGKKKAFSTCSSHLIVVCLFYGTIIIVYIRPKGSHYDKFLSLMYTVITPMLNPFIYTLRNTEVKNALQKSVRLLRKQVL